MNNAALVQDLFDCIASEYYAKTCEKGRIQALQTDPLSVFHPEEFELLQVGLGGTFAQDVVGKNIAVIGSGDNIAACALALLGARVTSVDVSQRQLDYAQTMAHMLAVDMQFVCCDAMNMPADLNNSFDLVYSTNGFITFVSDLSALYESVYRVLKRKGALVLFDAHPFIRPFAGRLDVVAVKKPYEAIGPFTAACVFHWRISDILNALARAGFVIKELREPHALPGTFWSDFIQDEDELRRAYDWHENGLAALPQWLGVYARKGEVVCS